MVVGGGCRSASSRAPDARMPSCRARSASSVFVRSREYVEGLASLAIVASSRSISPSASEASAVTLLRSCPRSGVASLCVVQKAARIERGHAAPSRLAQVFDKLRRVGLESADALPSPLAYRAAPGVGDREIGLLVPGSRGRTLFSLLCRLFAAGAPRKLLDFVRFVAAVDADGREALRCPAATKT